MNKIDVLKYEWKHFTHNIFKAIAVILFIIASVYGLQNGASLYQEQNNEIIKIKEKMSNEREAYIFLYEEGKKSPTGQPWVDLTSPYWAVWYSSSYHFKKPSPAMVYSIGQAEQYGFYKKINTLASPYDPDMSEEIANPERLQLGQIDFSFTVLYLLPLLMLILLYNLRSMEIEFGFLPLIEIQARSNKTWLFSRLMFYIVLIAIVLFILLLYGASLTNLLTNNIEAFTYGLILVYLYLFFWTCVYFFILKNGKNILDVTLKMVGMWLLFSFIIPASVHQWVSIEKPINLMTDFIDNKRDKQEEFFKQSDSLLQAHLNELFPDILESPVYKEGSKISKARNQSYSALINNLLKPTINQIEADNRSKNELIESTFWYNPIPFFQNRLNLVSETHYDSYQKYRDEIQMRVSKHIDIMVQDIWNAVEVDKKKYIEYTEMVSFDD